MSKERQAQDVAGIEKELPYGLLLTLVMLKLRLSKRI
jgi:hypothetical protein